MFPFMMPSYEPESTSRLMRTQGFAAASIERIVAQVLNHLHKEIVELQSYHPDADPYRTFSIFNKIVSLLISNPNEPKYRRLKKSNSKVNKHLLRYQSAQRLLEMIGFEVEFDVADDAKMDSDDLDTRDSIWVFRGDATYDSHDVIVLDAVQIQSEMILRELKRKRQEPSEAILEAMRCAPARLRFLLEPKFSENDVPDTRDFLGIRNVGSVCYLNSMLQVLFFNASFRRLIFAVERPEDGDVDEVKDDAQHIIFTLQEFFYALFTRTQMLMVDPTMLLKAFGWYGDQINEQRDVNEFQMAFMDKIEEGLKGLDALDTFRSAFYGRETVRIFSEEVEYESRTPAQPFSVLTLQISDANSLEEALADYIQGTTNVQIDVDGIGRTDCKQQWELEELPPILHFHLQRFEVDRETFQYRKRHDRLEFPLEFDMSPYVIDKDMEEDSLQYELYGVLVHNGTTNAGHYWAYVRCSVVTDGEENQTWYCMNDDSVKETTWETVREYSFGTGGEQSSENGLDVPMQMDQQDIFGQFSELYGGKFGSLFGSMSMPVQSPDFASAYMLIYVAKREFDGVVCPLESDYKLPSFHDLQTAIEKTESLRKSKYQDGKLINQELIRRGLKPKPLCFCGKCLQKRKEQFA